jgi:hypothetical protein
MCDPFVIFGTHLIIGLCEVDRPLRLASVSRHHQRHGCEAKALTCIASSGTEWELPRLPLSMTKLSYSKAILPLVRETHLLRLYRLRLSHCREENQRTRHC